LPGIVNFQWETGASLVWELGQPFLIKVRIPIIYYRLREFDASPNSSGEAANGDFLETPFI
jgi:hypothetical protein